METLNGIKFLCIDEYTSLSEAEENRESHEDQLLHCYTRHTSLDPTDFHNPVTIFSKTTTESCDDWISAHLEVDEPNVLMPLTSNGRGVVVRGHVLPWRVWCGLYLDHLQKDGREVTLGQWLTKVTPHILKIFKGVSKSLTCLEAKNKFHGNLENGIFVSVFTGGKKRGKDNRKTSPHYLDEERLRGFLGNFQGGGDKGADRREFVKVLLKILSFPSQISRAEELLPHLENYRLYIMLTELEKKESTVRRGYFYPCFWTLQEEVTFLDFMFKLLFCQVGIASPLDWDGAFEPVDPHWQQKIREKELLDRLTYETKDAKGKAISYDYSSRISIIKFYRNCCEHVNHKGWSVDDVKSYVLWNMPIDLVSIVHECLPNLPDAKSLENNYLISEFGGPRGQPPLRSSVINQIETLLIYRYKYHHFIGKDQDLEDNELDGSRNHGLGSDGEREMNRNDDYDGVEPTRKRKSLSDDHHSRDYSLDSGYNSYDEVKEQLEISIQKREELKEEIVRMEQGLDERNQTVVDFQKKSKKLEDSLTSAKKHTSQRKIQLTKLHKLYVQVRDYTEKLKVSELELQSVVDSAVKESDYGGTEGRLVSTLES